MTHFALSMFSVSTMWTQQRNFYLAIVSYLSISSSAFADLNISLVGSARCYGRVEIYYSASKGTLCNDSWVLNDAVVVCRQLKCRKALVAAQPINFSSSTKEMWLANVTCSGQETSLTQCHHRRFVKNGCGCDKVVGVVCSESLQQPNISLTSLDGVQVWGPNADAEVTKGHSFVFTCFINSSYNPSHFRLIFSGSNITHSKPAVNNSASFSFPAAEYEHQGNYSCVYHVTLESENLTSTESAPIHVVITFPWLLLVYSVVPAAILLLLLVLLVVWLAIRRRRRARQPGGHVEMQITATNHYDEEEEEEERDYVNVQPVDRKQTNKTQEVDEDETDDHDYENMENEDNYLGGTPLSVSIDNRAEEDTDETSDDDNDYETDYVNVTEQFAEQTVGIYGEEILGT